jgi:hypothetical protein
MSNTPIIKKRNGAFSVAVFEETKQDKNGNSYQSRSVVLQKSYKDQNGEWQRQTINMFDNNVAEVALLLQATFCDLVGTKSEPAEPAHKEETKSVEDLDECPF